MSGASTAGGASKSRSRKEAWDEKKLLHLLATHHLPGVVYVKPAQAVPPHLQHLVKHVDDQGAPIDQTILQCLRAVGVYLNTPAWQESAAFSVIQPRVDALIASDFRRRCVLRQTASLENTPEVNDARDIVDFCMDVFDCCWGHRAECRHRALWFCFAKYSVEMFGVEDRQRDPRAVQMQYYKTVRRSLWETLPVVMDMILSVIDVLRRSNEIQLTPEEILVVNRVFDVLMSPEHTVNGYLSVMEYMDRARIRSSKPEISWRLRIFNDLQKGLRKSIKSLNWNDLFDSGL